MTDITATSTQFAAAPDRKRPGLADRYLTWLGFALLGYAVMGKGFAYWGAPPLFVGEMLLIAGIVVVFASCRHLPILGSPLGMLLLAFIALGLARTIPFVSTWGIDALRDGMVWGYSIYAIIVACLIAQDPVRLKRLLLMFRRFVSIFVIVAPLLCFLMRYFGTGGLPTVPGSPNVQVVQIKGGDLLVQVTGVFCYIAVIGCDLNPWVPLVILPVVLALNVQGRAGMVTFLLGFVLVGTFKPYSKFLRYISITIVTVIGLLWITGLHIRFDGDAGGPRDVSFDQLSSGVMSIFGDSEPGNLDGTKEWRLKWWQTIEDYTLHGPYFWTGKGYGINLAEDDGFQVNKDKSLRNPHNAHMTFLARSGVPGLVMWIVLQAAFAVALGRAYLRARQLRMATWVNVFLFLFVYWAAYLCDASFDVFLEGPMGAIWFWSVYGTGMGALYVFDHFPETLDDFQTL